MERSIKHSNDWGEEGVSRRSFLGGASAAAVGSAMCENAPFVGYAAAAESSNAPIIGPDAVPATLRINGVVQSLVVPLQMTLAEVLREPSDSLAPKSLATVAPARLAPSGSTALRWRPA